MVGSFNNWNTIKLTNKTTLHEDSEDIYMVVLYVISGNMELLLQEGKYGAIKINLHNLTPKSNYKKCLHIYKTSNPDHQKCVIVMW